MQQKYQNITKLLQNTKKNVALSMIVFADVSNIKSISDLSKKYTTIVFVKELSISLTCGQEGASY